MKIVKSYLGIALLALCLTGTTFADGDMQTPGRNMVGDMQTPGRTMVGDMQTPGKTVATNNKEEKKNDSIFQSVLEFLGLDIQF